MSESSKQNPEKLFNFKITPLMKFRLAIDALCERDFNPIGFGVIQVSENKVEFTARNVDTNDAGYLVLNSAALQDFKYTSKCKDKLMRFNFRKNSQIITVAESSNDDSIAIFHNEGSNKLAFSYAIAAALWKQDFNLVAFGVTELIKNRVDYTARNVNLQDAGYVCLNSQSSPIGVLPSILRQVYGRIQKSSNFWQSVPDFLKLVRDYLQGKERQKGRRIEMRRPRIMMIKPEEIVCYSFTPLISVESQCSFCSQLLKKLPAQNFSFTITPLTKFRLAINTLSDREFNASGNGLIQVSTSEVKFTVSNMHSNVTAVICLDSTALMDFQCSRKIKDKRFIVNFRAISKLLAEWGNVNSVTIFHIEGSTDLTLIFGNDPVKEYKVQLYQQNKVDVLPIFTERPEIIFFGEAIISSDLLREMLGRLQTIGSQLVSVTMTENSLSVSIGVPPVSWQFEMASGQNHEAQFIWSHLQMLRTALPTAPELAMSFYFDEEVKMVMKIFSLQELGDLKIISPNFVQRS